MGSCISKAKAGVTAAKTKSADAKDTPKNGAKDAAKDGAKDTIQPTTQAVEPTTTAAGDTTDTAKDTTKDVKDAVEETKPAVAAVPTDAAKDDVLPAPAPKDADDKAKEEPTEGDKKADDDAQIQPHSPDKGTTAPAAPVTPADSKAPETAAAAASTADTPPSISDGFAALMAGTLEAVRAGIEECATVASSGGLRNLVVSFSDLTLAVRNEMIIEEEAYFSLIDEHFEGAARNAGLYDAHRADEALEKRVDDALSKTKDLDAAVVAFDAWRAHHLQHIDRELDVLGAPFGELPARLGTPEQAARTFNARVLDSRMAEMPWFASWNVAMLRKYKTFEALSDWVVALRRIATPHQWNELKDAAFAPLADEDRQRLQKALKDVPALVV